MKVLIAVLAAALAAACVIDVSQQQTANPNAPTVIGDGDTPTPGAEVCQPVGRVNVAAPATLTVGDRSPVDATPTDRAGNARSDACNLLAGIRWEVVGPCALSQVDVYTPELEAAGAGSCVVSAFVEGIQGSSTVRVEP